MFHLFRSAGWLIDTEINVLDHVTKNHIVNQTKTLRRFLHVFETLELVSPVLNLISIESKFR